MNKLIFLFLFAVTIQAQTMTPVKYMGSGTPSSFTGAIKFFNTAGVWKKQFTLYGSSGTVADTMVSSIITNDWDVINASFKVASDQDTIHANMYYQPIYGELSDSGSTGAAWNKGYWREGAGPLSAIQDSINVLGVRGGASGGTTKSYMGMMIPVDVFSGYVQTTTSEGAGTGATFSQRDSIRTGVYTYNTIAKGVTGWRIVIISHPNKQDVTNTTLFDNLFIILRRKQNNNQ